MRPGRCHWGATLQMGTQSSERWRPDCRRGSEMLTVFAGTLGTTPTARLDGENVPIMIVILALVAFFVVFDYLRLRSQRCRSCDRNTWSSSGLCRRCRAQATVSNRPEMDEMQSPRGDASGQGSDRVRKEAGMTRKQRCAVWAGVVLIVLMGLIPPWIHWGPGRAVGRSLGYWPLFSPPEVGVIDYGRLVLQWVLVILVIGAYLMLERFRGGK